MTTESDNFQTWLVPKLQELSVDETVFGSYIIGILEGTEPSAEKLEALEGILAATVEDEDISQICEEILKKWTITAESVKEEVKTQTDMDDKLVKIMAKQAQSVAVVKTYTEEEKQLKQSILAQYAEVSDGEASESEEEHEAKDEAAPDLARNTNLEEVLRLEKDKKDRLRLEAQKKKEKDKEDMEKQKRGQDDRKDKEKKRTQKGEKRR